MGLPAFSVRKPVLISMLFTAMIILGIISLTRLKVELYQGQNQGIVSIIVRARGGLPPPDVEKNITRPVEEAVSTVTHLRSLYSHSREAESRVTMEFETGTDMNFAALEVREKFARVKPLLPREIEKPIIANYDDAQAAILIFALTSDTLSPEEIRELVESDLKPVLARVDGVASVEVYGGRERKILVELDRDKMVAYNISIERVMDILGQQNINLLAGNVDMREFEYSVRTMGAFESVEEIGDIGLKATRQGSIIPLKELATVKDSYMEAADNARLNLEQNVTVYVKKESLSTTIPVVKSVRAVLDEFEKDYSEQTDVIIVSDKAEAISRAIGDVRNALFVGMFLTVLVIYLFLRQTILALIVLIAIPCSVIITFVFMAALGISINVMTLSGLALAIGILVDSAVVILENIFAKKEQGYLDGPAIRIGAEEVWLPLLASMVTTLIVFLPVVFIDKKIQLTYAGFAFTVSASLIASFFVAQMLVPMLMMQWARGTLTVSQRGSEDSFQAKARRAYVRLMRWNLKLRYPVVAILIVLFSIATTRIITRDIDWPSSLEENEFSIVVFPLAGARLEANDDAVLKVEDVLSKISDIEMFSTTVRKDDIKIFVRLKPSKERVYSKDEIMELLDEKGNEMVKEVHDDYSLIIDEGVSTTEQKKLVINIFGHENDVLEKLAREVAALGNEVEGYVNLVMTDLRKRPEYSLVVDKGRAAIYGLDVKDIADSIHAQVRGMRPTKFHELTKGEEIETITRLQAIYRQKIEDLSLVRVSTDEGTMIPIGELANFYPSTGPQTIDRKDKYRYVFVKGDTKRALESIAKEMSALLYEKLEMPDDYYWRFGGAYDELIKGKNELTIALILTVALVYMVLACMFQNYLQPFLVMMTVPMASIGIWAALGLTGKPLSQPVFIGMILLAGYVVNSAIIIVDRMNHLLAESDKSLADVLVEAGLDRLRPILMTTFSTGFGFLPMALSWGQSSDLWSPLAVTVIGGLLSSTFLTLFVLPDFILIADEFQKISRRGSSLFVDFIQWLKNLAGNLGLKH
ncbi:MAG: efflux RND transporter permease subunit [Candidatus Omnitrophota bacterium]|nr:efflux RND transporter permease subunit [Candidatus Omnitrophota bacterium]